jgi:preprotein translocase subunit SecE
MLKKTVWINMENLWKCLCLVILCNIVVAGFDLY